MAAEPAIVVIGGGTGSFAVLQGLKQLTTDITALVSMLDDGGSTGVLRDELGVLPPGDVRQCLVALSDAPLELRQLFNYRFAGEGSFAGHSFGNLFISALEGMQNDFTEAVRLAGDVLRIRGRVLPITVTDARLVLTAPDGTRVVGEHQIDVMHLAPKQRRPDLSAEPAAAITPEAAAAIERADLIVLAPGDLYTSLGALLAVQGVGQALRNARADVVYLCNLVVKPGHTDGFDVADHAAEIERLAGGPVLQQVIYNTAQPIDALVRRYAKEGEDLVPINETAFAGQRYRALGRPLLAPMSAAGPASRETSFGVPRSFIRHDANAVAHAVKELL